MTTDPIRISPFDLHQVEHRLSVLNRRAKKLGIPPVEIEISPLIEKEERFSDAWEAFPRVLRYHEVRILTDHTPRIEGYALAATVDFENGAVLVNGNPSFTGELPARFRSTDDHCDHCNTNRVRNSVVILEKEGEFIQVGRNCVKDFLGHDPSQIFSVMTLLNNVSEEFEEISRRTPINDGLPTKLVLAVAVAMVANHGYISRKRAEELDFEVQTTASSVRHMFSHTTHPEERKAISEWWAENVTEARKEEAQKIIDWVQEQEATSDYFHNLIALTAMQSITWRRVGIVSSAVIAYQKAMNLLKEREARPESNFVGELNKRQEFTVKLNRVMACEGFYGTTFIHFFTDESGNDLTWFGSSELNVDKDEVVRIKGTVKKHEVYKDRKQTIINRVALVDSVAVS